MPLTTFSRNPADRASCVERCRRLDAVGRKRSQQTASEVPACDRHTAFIKRARRWSFSAYLRGVGCRVVAAIHPGGVHTRVVLPCISRCKMRRAWDLRASTVGWLAAKDTASQVHNS